jgi:hypothetical protein
MPGWPSRRGDSPLCMPGRPSPAQPAKQARAVARAGPPPMCRRKRTAPDAGFDERIGPATESRDQHVRRHGPNGDRACPRCRWYAMESVWSAAYGRFSGPASPQPRSWIAERPCRWGGAWGLGCTLCGQIEDRRRGDADRGPRASAGQARRRVGTKFSRFEVRPATLQADHFANHRASDVHKIALHAWSYPDEPILLRMQETLSDDRLLSGSVPQVHDWVRAWRTARSQQSWRAAAEKDRTEHFISNAPGRSTASRPQEHMAVVVLEVMRQNKKGLPRCRP